jgi:hypothetical protein
MSAEHPLVSVVIPAFNSARWIDDTLRSALGQSWPHLEVIVADGGSTDGTREAVLAHADARVRWLAPDGGAQSAGINRSRGLAAAQGEFVQYLDADDLLSSDKIARQMARLESSPGAIASGEWGRFATDAAQTRFDPERVWRDLAPCDWLVQAWTGGLPMLQPGIFLLPRAVADRAGAWQTETSPIDDLDYMTRAIIAADRVLFCDGARLHYRSGNVSSLAHRQSPDAMGAAFRTVDRATGYLLAKTTSPEAKRACADMFQQLAFTAFLIDASVARAAEAKVQALGGSDVTAGGGVMFRVLERTIGWKRAAQVKDAAYRAGYARARGYSRATETGK